MNIVDKIDAHFFGTPEERWKMSGADFTKITANDQAVFLPEWDVEVSNLEPAEPKPIIRGEQQIGQLHSFQATINGKHPRNAYLWQVDEEFSINPNTVVSDRAALTTEVDGYPFARARKLAHAGLSTLQIGTEHSGKLETSRLKVPKFIKGLSDAAMLSLDMSIMKTAQEEDALATQIYHRILRYQPDEFVIGDSQGGMTAFARIAHAKEAGRETKGIDVRALCAHEKTSLAKAAFWLTRELAETPEMVAEMILNGETEGLKETISTNPRLLLGATFGKIPALLSGELEKTLQFVDHDVPGQMLRYESDGISVADQQKFFADFQNINHRDVPGNHLALARRRGIDSQVDRLVREITMDRDRGSLKNLTQEEAKIVYLHGTLTEDGIGTNVVPNLNLSEAS